MLLLTAATWSPLAATAPPSPSQLIPGWIGLPVLFSLLVWALDRRRVRELPA